MIPEDLENRQHLSRWVGLEGVEMENGVSKKAGVGKPEAPCRQGANLHSQSMGFVEEGEKNPSPGKGSDCGCLSSRLQSSRY